MEPPQQGERMRLIIMVAWLAGMTNIAGPVPAPAAQENAAGEGLVVTVDAGGGVRAEGKVFRNFSVKALKKRIPEIDLSGGITNTGDGGPEEWTRTLDALTIVIPRLREGAVRIAEHRIEISGILQPGFNADATRGAIRLALGSTWEVEIVLEEAPPPAALALHKTADGIEISGILPAGVDPAETLTLLGGKQVGGLTSGGGGDAAAWSAALASLGELVNLYADVTASVSDGAFEIDGTFLPGYEAGRLGQWFGQRLGDGWQVSLAGHEVPTREGDIRVDLTTGGTEQLRRGRWLPVLDFEPGPEICASQTQIARSGDHISFVTGKSQIDRSAEALLDRLAGVAIRCLNDGGLELEIGGHTDNLGGEDGNMALSQKRAMAVLLELIDRGVRADAMTAIGYGESSPVADNGTQAGRATNRRITFKWID